MPDALAFRYARALADLAAQTGADPEAIGRDLAAFTALLRESADLRIALESPAVPPPRKRAVISHLARELGISDLARRFLLVLADHRRAGMLNEIREAFETVTDERMGVARVDVRSARELSEPQRRQILVELARITGKRTRPRFAVDPELVGGFSARIGSTVYDGSVRGQLQALKEKLVGAVS